MGNDQSYQYQPQSKALTQLSKILSSSPEQTTNHTNSLLYNKFAKQAEKIQNGPITRSSSPFCPVLVDQHWFTACMISPVMAITSYRCLFNKKKFLYDDIMINLINEEVVMEIQICEVIKVGSGDFAILVLKEPFWKNGWVGLTPFEIQSQQKNMNRPPIYKIFSHPDKKQNGVISQHIQSLKKIEGPRFPNQNQMGSILCKTIKHKQYIMGLQSSPTQMVLLTEDEIVDIRKKARSYLNKNSNEQRILKEINIAEFQMLTMW